MELIDFGHSLPRIYADCDKYMLAAKPTRNKIIAIIIKIISLCYFRVGNAKYIKLYNHYGISTIKKNHVKVTPRGVHIKFIGKKGVLNECMLEEPKIVNAVKSLLNRKNGDNVFVYEEGKEKKVITAIEINDWLQQYGPDFSTKMFRNYDANVMFIEFARKEHSGQDHSPDQLSLAKRKKILAAGMKAVSQEINNTPAICKKAYMSPDLIQLYLDHPRKFKTLFLKKGLASAAFISFLKTLSAGI